MAKTTKAASKSTKKSSKGQRNQFQLLIVVAVFAIIGVGALLITQARQGNVGGGNASIGGVSSCNGGVWAISARAQSSTAALLPVDIFDDSTTGGAGFRLLASNISLPYIMSGNFYTFQDTPLPGAQKVTMYVVVHGGNPAQETILASARILNPCL